MDRGRRSPDRRDRYERPRNRSRDRGDPRDRDYDHRRSFSPPRGGRGSHGRSRSPGYDSYSGITNLEHIRDRGISPRGRSPGYDSQSAIDRYRVSFSFFKKKTQLIVYNLVTHLDFFFHIRFIRIHS